MKKVFTITITALLICGSVFTEAKQSLNISNSEIWAERMSAVHDANLEAIGSYLDNGDGTVSPEKMEKLIQTARYKTDLSRSTEGVLKSARTVEQMKSKLNAAISVAKDLFEAVEILGGVNLGQRLGKVHQANLDAIEKYVGNDDGTINSERMKELVETARFKDPSNFNENTSNILMSARTTDGLKSRLNTAISLASGLYEAFELLSSNN